MDEYPKLTLLLNAIFGIGTIMVSILAIFGDKVRSYFFHPKFNLKVESSGFPFIENLTEESSESSRESPEMKSEVRIKISNDGNFVAKNTSVLVTDLWVMKGDNTYCKEEILPSELMWLVKTTVSDITKRDLLPSLPGYLALASIAKDNTLTTNDNKNTQDRIKDSLALFIMIESSKKGLYKKISSKACIVKLVVCTETHKLLHEKFIKIFWDGSRVDLMKNKIHFDVVIMTKEQLSQVGVA